MCVDILKDPGNISTVPHKYCLILFVFHFCPAADAIPELRQSNFQGLTVNKNGLIAVGKVQTQCSC